MYVVISVAISVGIFAAYSYLNRDPPPPPPIPPTDVPIGTILPYAGNKLPVGWIACDNASYPPTTYPLLYAAIGYTYGMDGGNYRVPDTRGVFMRGMDVTAVRDTNRPAGSVQLDTLAYDGGNVNEIGMVSYFAVNKPPANWLACDGTIYQVGLYLPLYNVIGNLYGGASGSTFAVPDLRGQFIRGFDPTGTVDVDRQKGGFGAKQADTIQNITGSAQGMYYSRYPSMGGAMAGSSGNIGSGQTVGPAGGNGDAGNVQFDASKVVRTSTETRPKNVALLPCIRFR